MPSNTEQAFMQAAVREHVYHFVSFPVKLKAEYIPAVVDNYGSHGFRSSRSRGLLQMTQTDVLRNRSLVLTDSMN